MIIIWVLKTLQNLNIWPSLIKIYHVVKSQNCADILKIQVALIKPVRIYFLILLFLRKAKGQYLI